MQISNKLVSIANYTATSVKSGFSYTVGSIGRFGVSTLKSGASLVCKTVRCAGSFFGGSASFALSAAGRHPKISMLLGVLAGAATAAYVAKKRFNFCVLEKLSGYCPLTTKKVEEKQEEAVEAEKVTKADDGFVAEESSEEVSDSDEDTATEPYISRNPSPAYEAQIFRHS
jgi:hypothetical protein